MLRKTTATSLAAFLLAWTPARASFLSGEALDTAADIMAVVVLFVVPVVLITVFWLVHVLPEKVAEQREHPQKEAIKVICLLSLFFGGLLWPIAWVMAYSKPVLYRLAYGRDKHDDYYEKLARSDAPESNRLHDDVVQLRSELDSLAARGTMPPELQELRLRLTALEARVASVPANPASGGGAG